jgi:hypothetical protein
VLVTLKRLFGGAAVTAALCTTLSGQAAQTAAEGQGQQAAAQKGPQWKDRAEYDLYQAFTKETDVNKKIELLNQWKEKYPQSEFKKMRAGLYLGVYQQAGQPKQMLAAAKDMLAEDPKEFSALSVITYLTPTLNDQSPEALQLGEQAARGVLENISTAPKPANLTAEQWTKTQNDAKALAYKTVGWVNMIRKDNVQAADNFVKSLELNPAQGDVSYWTGQAVLAQKDVEKYPLGLYHVARAAAYDGPGALPPAGRQSVEDYLQKAYKGFHGEDPKGLDQLKQQAKTTALPPAGFDILSVKEIAEQKLKEEQEFAANNPRLAMWKNIRSELDKPEGAAYFEQNMKGAAIPELRGWVVSQSPESRPKTVVVSISDKSTPEITLELDTPLAGPAQPGTEVVFEGVAKTFSKEPFMLTMDVEKTKLSGWPEAPKAPAKSKPRGAKSRRR